ncbi:Uncharacterized protein Fot_41469 [Forsythia ovata]|uniref:Uncharacterized protein n=1 Tax=Forsythia ovata TaxID=205694 RepID=A0ABD1RID2_9LAMI
MAVSVLAARFDSLLTKKNGTLSRRASSRPPNGRRWQSPLPPAAGSMSHLRRPPSAATRSRSSGNDTGLSDSSLTRICGSILSLWIKWNAVRCPLMLDRWL